MNITLSKTTHRQLTAAVTKAVTETGDPVQVAKLCRSLAGIEERRGNPRKITAEVIAQVEALQAAKGLTRKAACQELGLSYDSVNAAIAKWGK
jgi:hypothetical protein